MKNYISQRIYDKIDSKIKSYAIRINALLKTRHQSYSKTDKEMNYNLINFTLRNLKVWKELKKRNDCYEKRIQK